MGIQIITNSIKSSSMGVALPGVMPFKQPAPRCLDCIGASPSRVYSEIERVQINSRTCSCLARVSPWPYPTSWGPATLDRRALEWSHSLSQRTMCSNSQSIPCQDQFHLLDAHSGQGYLSLGDVSVQGMLFQITNHVSACYIMTNVCGECAVFSSGVTVKRQHRRQSFVSVQVLAPRRNDGDIYALKLRRSLQ